MARITRLASSLLLATGIVLVFAGLSAALGYTGGGMIASVAAIAALIYAGAVWFGPTPPAMAPIGAETVVVFDRSLHIVAGGSPGAPVLKQFPAALRETVEPYCRAALAGEHGHFVCEIGGRRLTFDVAPIQMMGGAVLYGVLITGAGTLVPVTVQRPATTVA